MGLDKANIFKLDNEEQAEYKNDPFFDCFESIKTFAKALLHDIETKETPHSLLLSADYGMGKTFFSTRFAQYMKNNKYDVIYFSVWENDYMNEPFLAFSKVIVNYIHNKYLADRYKANISKLFQVIEDITSSISIGAGVSVSAEKLITAFKKKTDPIIEFRKQLTAFVRKIKKKKLILIVDELDRCRPDYAMKTLECIKHFFDIEGLFIIIPTNTNALNDCIKSLYGIDNCERKNSENYFKKFFNDKRNIKKPTEEDYLYIVNQYITKNRLKEAISKKLLSENDNLYNSLNSLKNHFAHYSYKKALTVREAKDYSIELCRICNNFYEPIRTEWLCCLMVYRDVNKDDNFVYPLSREHCMYKERFKLLKDTPNGKKDLFKMQEYYSILKDLKQISYVRDNNNYQVDGKNYFAFISTYTNTTRGYPNIENYVDLSNYISKIKEELNTLKVKYSSCPLVIENFNIIQKALDAQNTIVNQYQNYYGSDDKDDSRREKYIKIIENLEQLYSIHQ